MSDNRFKEKMTLEEFQSFVIAQDDDEDYDESGYVAVLHGDDAAIGHYGHCSCYDTFTDLCGGSISDYYTEGIPTFDWYGSAAQLCEMASMKLDPSMPERKANPDDWDYDHLIEMYKQVMAYYKETSYLNSDVYFSSRKEPEQEL